MMIKKLLSYGLVALLMPALVLADVDDEEDRAKAAAMGEEASMSRGQVPPKVLAAASKAKPGAFFSDIRRSLRDDNTYYTFYASQVGKYYVIVVREDAQVMEVDEEGEAPASDER